MSEFRIEIERAGGVTVVRPCGRMDSSRAGRLEAVLKEEIAEGRDRLVINFRETLFIASSGLRVLLVTHRAVSGSGVLLVAGFLPHVADMVRTAGFDTLLEVRPDVLSAVAEARAGVEASPDDGDSGGRSEEVGESGGSSADLVPVVLRHGVFLGTGTLVVAWIAGWQVALWLGGLAAVVDVWVLYGPWWGRSGSRGMGG